MWKRIAFCGNRNTAQFSVSSCFINVWHIFGFRNISVIHWVYLVNSYQTFEERGFYCYLTVCEVFSSVGSQVVLYVLTSWIKNRPLSLILVLHYGNIWMMSPIFLFLFIMVYNLSYVLISMKIMWSLTTLPKLLFNCNIRFQLKCIWDTGLLRFSSFSTLGINIFVQNVRGLTLISFMGFYYLTFLYEYITPRYPFILLTVS